MSLIEKAVERLDQLKHAAQVPGEPTAAPAPPPAAPAPTPAVPQQAAAAPPVAAPAAAPQAAPRTARAAVQQPALRVPTPEQRLERTTPSVRRNARMLNIDLMRLANLGMVTPDKPRSGLAEQFRIIKRPLIRNAQGLGAVPVEHGNLIMVTSSMPGEGKSFSAINLAVSMAMELDFTVLLVDGDFAKPSVLSRLGLPDERGLMDVLVGEIEDIGDVIFRTSIEKLSILPAGMPHPRATELIASAAMGNVLTEIGQRYSDRIIVFDSAPLLATTEARALFPYMGQIVLVVEAGRTTQGAVQAALSMLESCPVKMLLLNKAQSSGEGELYGYGYGYGYGQGSDARSET